MAELVTRKGTNILGIGSIKKLDYRYRTLQTPYRFKSCPDYQVNLTETRNEVTDGKTSK